jgi:hypothetical protein
LARNSLKEEAGAVAMSEPFLEEQLRRIRQMSARISEASSHQREVSESIEREHERRYRSRTAALKERVPHSTADESSRRPAADRRLVRAGHSVDRRRR